MASTTEIDTHSLHAALPICGRVDRRDRRSALHARRRQPDLRGARSVRAGGRVAAARRACSADRSEEYTSELQSRRDLVCRLLLEKKKREAYKKVISIRNIRR